MIATTETPPVAAENPASEKPQGFGPVHGVSRDRDGRLFDSELHFPEKDDNGRWRRKVPGKPGRPKGSKKAAKPAKAQPTASEPPPADFSDIERIAKQADAAQAAEENPASADKPAGEADQPGVPMPKDDYERAAVATVSAAATGGILILGAHVAPNPDQIKAMVTAYADCYRAYGYAPQTPPWMGPLIATAAWIGPHLADRRSQENLQGWKMKLALFWAKLRGKRDARAAAQVATEAASA